ncbi:hypothetical protein [Schumannella soli]|uniref:Uncharacterized protein n=1 Tax=Schumannella soli TaxID=2590779 RepID=A0A506XXL9_9MICO|nr:hypothetical protein [Schumannella soli]TPW77511.1 hypothetical protein FJ657_02180 [Schumannella soli]
MGRAGRAALAVAVIGAAGAATASLVVRRAGGDDRDDDGRTRWNRVTILGAEGLFEATQPPSPLDELGDAIEWRVDVAPGDRGVELAARPSAATATGDDRRQSGPSRDDVHRALREAKQLIEIGEVTRRDPAPEGHRRATPAGAVVDELSRRSGGKGVL